MKKKKKKLIVVTAAALMISPVVFSTIGSTYAYASELDQAQQAEEVGMDDEHDTYTAIKNDLYIEYEREFEELQASQGELSKEEAFQLIEKYDGAEIIFIPKGIQPQQVQIASTSFQFVSGGVNSFATNKSSMLSLGRTFHNAGDAAFMGGTIIGLPLQLFGAVIAGLSSGYVSDKFHTAGDIMGRWYNSKSALQGGVRMTITDTFPIYHARNITPAVIP